MVWVNLREELAEEFDELSRPDDLGSLENLKLVTFGSAAVVGNPPTLESNRHVDYMRGDGRRKRRAPIGPVGLDRYWARKVIEVVAERSRIDPVDGLWHIHFTVMRQLKKARPGRGHNELAEAVAWEIDKLKSEKSW